jgi:hypothetical protein
MNARECGATLGFQILLDQRINSGQVLEVILA